jgi:hypothetical protein
MALCGARPPREAAVSEPEFREERDEGMRGAMCCVGPSGDGGGVGGYETVAAVRRG